MSFILDALKKSENERQRQVGPSLADVQVSQRRTDKPWWVVAVAALLVLNLGVLLVVLTRNGDAESGAPQATDESRTSNANAQPGTQMPLPASGRSAIAGIPARRSPAESSPFPPRVRTSAVASSCQTTSSVGASALARRSVVG